MGLSLSNNSGSGSSKSDPTAACSAATEGGSKVNKAAPLLTAPRFQKYNKMRRMHIPAGAIAQKMKTDGARRKTILTFIGFDNDKFENEICLRRQRDKDI